MQSVVFQLQEEDWRAACIANLWPSAQSLNSVGTFWKDVGLHSQWLRGLRSWVSSSPLTYYAGGPSCSWLMPGQNFRTYAQVCVYRAMYLSGRSTACCTFSLAVGTHGHTACEIRVETMCKCQNNSYIAKMIFGHIKYNRILASSACSLLFKLYLLQEVVMLEWSECVPFLAVLKRGAWQLSLLQGGTSHGEKKGRKRPAAGLTSQMGWSSMPIPCGLLSCVTKK